jgi:FlaA1/EpsC-like NDP-sugar epimerase
MSSDAKNNNRIRKRVQHWQLVSFYLVAYDAVAVTLSYFLALLIRFDFHFSMIPVVYFQPWLYFAPCYAVVCVGIFWRLRLYNSIWRFASFKELERITLATIVTTVIHIIGVTGLLYYLTRGTAYTVGRMPISYYMMGALLQFVFITGIRFSYRFILENKSLICFIKQFRIFD